MKPWKRLGHVRAICRPGDSFNGATAMKLWKSNTALHTGNWAGWLQWGHGDEAVEEIPTAARAVADWRLQWGHGDEAVEEARIGLPIATRISLQWGHGDEAVEEAAAPIRTREVNRASMGPRR